MDFIRIGEKVLSMKKIHKTIDEIFKLRGEGFSQVRVSEDLGVERSFVSRLESIGQVRKGEKIAVVGFPIKNKVELEELCDSYGIEYTLILTEKERWSFIENKSGLLLFNKLMEIMVRLKEYDLVIFLGSDMRLDLVDKLMEGNVVGIELGESPLKNDKYVDLTKISVIINTFQDGN
jgi:hypothetical protein